MSRVTGRRKEVIERREKRFIIPMIYLMAEIIVAWLVLTLIQVEFDIRVWDTWAIIIFVIGGVYSIIKTVNVYQRQKDYPKAEHEWRGLRE